MSPAPGKDCTVLTVLVFIIWTDDPRGRGRTVRRWAQLKAWSPAPASTWKMTATKLQWVSAPSRSYRGEAMVNGDELSGRAESAGCPCTFVLRRVNSDSIREKHSR